MSARPAIGSFDSPLEPAGPLSELVTANRQRDALFELSERLHRAQTLDSIYLAALHAIETALGCDRSSILLFDDADVMQFVAWHGLSDVYRAAVSGHSPWKKDEIDARPIAMPDIASAELGDSLKATILGEGIRAVAFIPLVSDGALIGKFMAYFPEPHAFTPEDLSVALIIARQLGYAIRRTLTDQRIRAHESELADELAATSTLQALALEIAHEADVAGLYENLVDAARKIMRSDFSSMQELKPGQGANGALKLVAHRGFDAEAVVNWAWVRANTHSSCGVAFRTGKRVIAADVESCDFLAGTPQIESYRAAGIRAMQSTPLRSRGGELVGMMSTHWQTPHAPSERDLRMMDILARLAADLIERKAQEEDLRLREERSRTLTQLLTDVPWQARSDGAFEVLQPAWENFTGQNWEAHAGHGWFEAVHHEERDAMRAAWSSACFDAIRFEFTARLWNAQAKEYRRCLIRATPIRNEDGTVREWVGACTDLQAKREPA